MILSHKIKTLAVTVATAALVTVSHAQMQLLQSWDFANSPSGLTPDHPDIVRSNPAGPHFTVGGNGQITTGSTLQISPTAALNAHLDVHQITLEPGFTTYRLEYVIGGWDWSFAAANAQTRRLSLGFAGTFNTTTWDPIDNFLFGAGGSVRMNAAGDIIFSSEAGLENDLTTVIPGFTAVQEDPIYLRIDVNAVDRIRVVTFSDTADFSNTLYTHSGATGLSRVSPDGALNRIRIGPLDGDGPEYWNGDWASIDSISYSMIPEPSTYALIAGLGILGWAFWRRSKKA